MRRNVIITSFLIFVFLLLGCRGEKEEVPRVIAPKKVVEKSKPKVEKKKEEKEEYSYNPEGKRDPFKPFIVVESKKPRIRKVNIPLTPLQKYDISELKLTAIIIGVGEPRAMVEDNFGKGYVVKVGDFIGKNGGQVLKIEKDKVTIRENYINYIGEEETRDIKLFLHKPEEGEGL
jgi:type IV pilus assembly protein PilP